VTIAGGSDQEIADAIAAEVAALLPPRYAGVHGHSGAPAAGSPDLVASEPAGGRPLANRP
jgi:hypothetical protein